jgi:predicted nucleic acid-binding protein
VLVAGVAGFKSQIEVPRNPSAKLLREWVESGSFVWLVSEEILKEYKDVMGRLGVRRNLIRNIINLLREEAEFLEVPVTAAVSPDAAADPFCACAEMGDAAFIVTLNPKDFPQKKLRAKIIAPGSSFPTTAPRRVLIKRQ